MKWILVVVFLTYSNIGGLRITTEQLEFDSKLSCSHAIMIFEALRRQRISESTPSLLFDIKISDCIQK